MLYLVYRLKLIRRENVQNIPRSLQCYFLSHSGQLDTGHRSVFNVFYCTPPASLLRFFYILKHLGLIVNNHSRINWQNLCLPALLPHNLWKKAYHPQGTVLPTADHQEPHASHCIHTLQSCFQGITAIFYGQNSDRFYRFGGNVIAEITWNFSGAWIVFTNNNFHRSSSVPNPDGSHGRQDRNRF